MNEQRFEDITEEEFEQTLEEMVQKGLFRVIMIDNIPHYQITEFGKELAEYMTQTRH